MKTLAYLRISTDSQDLKNQKYEILQYCNQHKVSIDEFVEIEISSRQDKKKRRIDELFEKLNSGDTLIVSELSRIGRSTGEVINLTNEFIKRQIKFVAIKQNLHINGKSDMQTKILVTLFSLLSELERDLISSRTVEALRAKKLQGIQLGRPKGVLGVSKLDDKKEQIRELLTHRVSKSAVARMFGVSRTTLIDFVRSRRLAENQQ